jgi:biopolymer transport protein ExbD
MKTFTMAAIETSSNPKQKNHKRINKKNTRVDLTPMVDLGFLLITFFVFTTQLSKPTVMSLNMPNDKAGPGDKICASCALTLLLQENNVIQYYEGMPELNPVVKQTSFAAGGIRNILLQKKKLLQQLKGKPDDFVVIIKSADKSTFQNFVDIVDEVAINNIKHYYIDEITPVDRKLLSKK